MPTHLTNNSSSKDGTGHSYEVFGVYDGTGYEKNEKTMETYTIIIFPKEIGSKPGPVRVASPVACVRPSVVHAGVSAAGTDFR